MSVDTKKRQIVIPGNYITPSKPGCLAMEQLIQVQPNIPSFTQTSQTPLKITFELPNYNFRLDEFKMELVATVNFTSNSGSDTYTAVRPNFVKWGTSLINQVVLKSGPTELVNYRQNNLRYNWEQNTSSNTISRLQETYNNPAPPSGYTTATAQTFRFPLTLFSSDFFSLPAVLPGEFMRKLILEVYFEAPNNCCYSAGTIVGTVFNYSYSIAGLNLQTVITQDKGYSNMIASSGVILNWVEPYWLSATVPTGITQPISIQIPVAFRSVRCILWGIRKVADLTDPTVASKFYLMSSENTSLTYQRLLINSKKRQENDFVDAEEVIPETRRAFPAAKFADYYAFATNNGTTALYGNLVGMCYSPEMASGLDTTSLQSQMYLQFGLTSALTSASQIDMLIFHDVTATITNGGLYRDD